MAEKKKYNSILISGRKDQTLTYSKYIKDEESGESVKESLDKKVNVTDELTTQQIKDGAIINEKLAADSVGNTNLQDGSVSNEKLEDGSITNEKLAENSITKDKLQDKTIGVEKLDNELRQTIAAAAGLPEDLVETIQNVDVSIAKLNDTVYPITLGFTISPNTNTMQTDVKYSITSDGKPLVPDTLEVTKQVNENTPKVLTNAKVASGTVQTKIEGGREIFKFAVTKAGRTGKSTSATRYLCYYGSSPVKDMTAEVMNTLSKVSSTGVSFNPQINTNNGDYIWLIIPNFLTINRVTSAGFDVSLAAVQTVTNSLGTFKAYRTANTLTTETWKLIIS